MSGAGRLSRHGERPRHRLSGEDLVVSVDQVDLHLVLAGRKPSYVDCIVVARIRPQPGQVVDGYVQILGLEDALGQRTGKRWIHNQFGCGLVLDCVVR